MIGEDLESLALRYRPRRFADVAGQLASVAVLYQMSIRGKIPGASILYGNRGSGKTTSARIVAAALNCKAGPGQPDAYPCLDCPSCRAVWNNTSLDYMEIDAASNGSAEKVRTLREELAYSSSTGQRVVVLDEAHSMSVVAFNAILKLLEEPPPGVSFILCTTELAKILATVRSRCVPFRFARLGIDVIAARLAWICQQENIPAEPALLAAIAEQADGAMRDAIMTLDQLQSVGIYDLARFQAMTGWADYAPGLISAMLAGDDASMFTQLDTVLQQNGDYSEVSTKLTGCLRDILVLLGGGQITAQGAALEARTSLAGRLDAPRVARAMRVMWELKTRVAKTEPKATLELACSVISAELRPPQAAPSLSAVPQPLTLAQMGNGHRVSA
jgi:DNA polymerase III subunit gamma/tau